MTSSRSFQAVTQLSDVASFSVSDSDKESHKKIRFYYDAPAPSGKTDGSDKLLLLNFLSEHEPPHEVDLKYSPQDKKWIADLDIPVNARDRFAVTSTVEKKDLLEIKMKAPVLHQDYIALTNGKPHPWIYEDAATPKGTLEKMLYKADGTLAAPVAEKDLSEGDRLITLYLPPDYKPDRVPPYNLQITLDGKQFLEAMQMNTVFDNLITAKQIEPTVIVFLSPYCGSPDDKKQGFGSVCPPGYSLEQRFKEYSCNENFADQLAALPNTLRDNKLNVTNSPEHTTIWGFSMGALQAGYTALLHPETFGNVVAQSMMAFNIPTQNGAHWREKITDDWQSATALLSEKETHNEYLSQMLASGFDTISNRSIPSAQPLKFYFTAGSEEEKYEPKDGFANLVAATGKFASILREKGHTVIEHPRENQEARLVLVVSPGGHTPITCKESTADAVKAMNPQRSLDAKLTSNASKSISRGTIFKAPSDAYEIAQTKAASTFVENKRMKHSSEDEEPLETRKMGKK